MMLIILPIYSLDICSTNRLSGASLATARSLPLIVAGTSQRNTHRYGGILYGILKAMPSSALPSLGNRQKYHSLESNSSSSSDEDDPIDPSTPTSRQTPSSLYRQYSKRLFKDSTSNLPALDSSPIFNIHENLPPDNHEIEGNTNAINQPKYVEMIKIEFFTLGLIIGAALQMLTVSIIIMFVSYSQHSGPLLELSHEYYPVFRCMFFISFFFTLYGGNLFLWRRVKIEYRSVLGVGSSHTYRKSS